MLSSNQENSYRIGELMEINNNQQPQPKKQIRRLHTNKPYQETFVNMAEARREIATALKFHRASMKQQQQQAAANHDHQFPPPDPATATTNYWPMPPPPPIQENFNLVLPKQTLGLNLNFNDFNNLNTSIYYNPMPASSGRQVSAAKEVVVAKPARWCKSLESIEVGTYEDDDGYCHPFEQVMEFPPWLINANETSCFQDMLDQHFCHEYSPDPALPCMDIGEIEGMDCEEWLT